MFWFMSNFQRTPYKPVQFQFGSNPQIKKDRVHDHYSNLELYFSSILECVLESIVVVNRNFEILYANSNYCKLVGHRKEQITGKHCYEVSHRNIKPCYQLGEDCTIRHTFDTGLSSMILHAHLDMEDNPVQLEIITCPIKDLSGTIVAVAKKITDITEKNKLAEDLKKRIKELEEFYDMAVGRELKMIELKEEIKNLRKELGRYKSGSRG